MGEGITILDILLVAMVAGFIFLRLRGVLGRRTGHERQRPDPYRMNESDEAADDNVITLPDNGREQDTPEQRSAEAEIWSDDSPIGAGLTQIKIADHNFEPGAFLQGAGAAYEMIVEAFADGDRKTLASLLTDDIYADFDTAISDRESQHHTLETTITARKSADIVDARMSGKFAQITVKFVSDMISVTRDETGEIQGGTPTEREVTDIWTFARDTSARDPNWLLTATSSEN